MEWQYAGVALDAAFASADGWNAGISEDEALRNLLVLNAPDGKWLAEEICTGLLPQS